MSELFLYSDTKLMAGRYNLVKTLEGPATARELDVSHNNQQDYFSAIPT